MQSYFLVYVVQWLRKGPVSIICTFTGLRRMPFDDLGCDISFVDDFLTPVMVEYDFINYLGSEGLA